MAETINSLEDLGSSAAVTAAAPAAPVHVQKLDKEGRAYATGKRKNAIARVWVKPGSGKITVNGKEFNQFFARPVARIVPYSTPARGLYICSSSTPPGGGVHGMCGFHAARAALRTVFGRRIAAP